MSSTNKLDDYFNTEFDKALNELEMNSSPGNCQMSLLGSTNGQILGWNGIEMDKDRVELLRGVVKNRFDLLRKGELISDPLNVFVKPEPHTLKKINDGRLRLISAVSLVDTMIDRVLFGWLGRKALQTCGKTPCMVGWSPVGGGWKQLRAAYPDDVLCLDKSMWDWSVQSYMIDMWYQFIEALALNASEEWKKLALIRFKLLFEEAVFKFKDGISVKQKYRGIMKSGCFLTIILNSVGQSFVHYLANVRLGLPPQLNQPHSMGDDTIQKAFDYIDQYIEEMRSLGVLVKGYKVKNWIEFCGFVVKENKCWPAYWQKHLFGLYYSKNLLDTLSAYQIMYVDEPEMFQYVTKLLLLLSPDRVLTLREAKSIMHGH